MTKVFVLGFCAVTLAFAAPAVAQTTIVKEAPAASVPGGAKNGAEVGTSIAGPAGGVAGGVVGGVVGGVAGGVAGVLGIEQRPKFRQYVVSRNVPSYAYSEEVRTGVVLPSSGVTYYDVPSEYGIEGSKYTIVNGRTVLVEPSTRRVIEVID